MLTFQQKLHVFESFPQLERRDVSLGRVNFHYEDSIHDKKTVGYHLHPNGNGFVYVGLMDRSDVNAKGYVNIRNFSEARLREIIQQSMDSLSSPNTILAAPSVSALSNAETVRRESPASASTVTVTPSKTGEELWHDSNGDSLLLKLEEEDLWYIYAGSSIEMVFETREEAEDYLREEGFVP
ncbi:hypothetical protein [Paenibacillus lentus]|uniref:Uncharacterized protein n=1 Tax=Paenibacillus lentus TaxID=1338368 RepID=A0A3Q8SDX7_9BACL|nr:hypothetical protein [Paenibacillus lentus]AZK48487.1 hypothetical protein EIM92_21820 [Paenibacillus lentus]